MRHRRETSCAISSDMARNERTARQHHDGARAISAFGVLWRDSSALHGSGSEVMCAGGSADMKMPPNIISRHQSSHCACASSACKPATAASGGVDGGERISIVCRVSWRRRERLHSVNAPRADEGMAEISEALMALPIILMGVNRLNRHHREI